MRHHWRNAVVLFASFLLTVAATAGASNGGVLRVDDDASPAGDGLTWDTAYRFLQDALADASGGGISEIRVAQGTYKPDRDEANPDGTGDREASFHLINGVALMGGYAGIGADDPDARDIELYETIFSGDLLGNDGPNFQNISDNVFHVVTGSGTDLSAHLNGVTAERAAATDSWPDNSGGGMINIQGSPTVVGCTFQRNLVRNLGAGMLNRMSSPLVRKCIFRDNGVPEIQNSVPRGGGMANWEGTPRIIDCIFVGNVAGYGGATREDLGTTTLFVNCQFIGNSAIRISIGGQGGAVVSSFASSIFTNCSFTNNVATVEGGAFYTFQAPLVIANSILWGNSDANGMGESSQIAGDGLLVDYSCVQGLTGNLGGIGNIGDDPLFVDIDGPDDIPGNEDDDLRLSPGSPCIDAADNTAVPPDEFDLDDDGDTKEPIPFDLDGNPRFVDDPDTKDTGNGDPPIVDMGAYEFQGAGIIEASLDIKPGSCPNSFNRNSHGMLPAAILGRDDFDAAQIDISSVMLSRADGIGGSVAPHEGPPGPHSVLDDVATPFDGEPCDCHELGGDGLVDLVMHFSSPELVETLELNDLPGDTQVPLMVIGELIDGSPFTATDCIRLVPVGDMNGDGVVGTLDLMILLNSWGSCAECVDCPTDLDGDCTVSTSDLLILLVNWG